MAKSFDDAFSESGPAPGPAGRKPPRPPQLSVLALFALLSGIGSLLSFCIPFLSIPASLVTIVLGHLARRGIRLSNGAQSGNGLAIGGLVLGYGSFVLSAAIATFFVVVSMKTIKDDLARNPAPFEDRNTNVGLGLAESKILTDSNGTALGNTAEARQLAERFSTLMDSMHDTAFTKTKARIKLTGGHYVTWCELREGQCAFVVHVPEYRRFNKEAKEVLSEIAWMAAQAAVSDTLQNGDRLAVGLKGVLMYGSIMVGTVSDEESKMTTVTAKGTKKGLLQPFFGEVAVDSPSDDSEADEEAVDGEEASMEGSVETPATTPPAEDPSDSGADVPRETGTPTAETSKITEPETIATKEADTEPDYPSTGTDDASPTGASEPASNPSDQSSLRRRVTGPRRMTGPRGLTENPGSARSATETSRRRSDLPVRSTSMPKTATEAVALLDAEDRVSRAMAQSFLMTHRPETPDSETAGKIIDSLRESQGPDAFSLASALEPWVTSDELPALQKLLEKKDQTVRHQLHRVIGKVGTVEAAKILARELSDSQGRFSAAIALRAMGKTAEPAVIPLLNGKDNETSLQACQILGEIGTKKSATGLQRLTKSKDLQISTSAKQALEQVRGR